MCTGLEIAALAATAGGTIMANQQQKSAMKDYNSQVTRQNKLLTDQFSERQTKIKNSQDAQARLFQEISADQDAEYAKQSELARQKQQQFEESVRQPVTQGAQSQEFQDAVDARNQLFRDTAKTVTADFGTSNRSGTENRVLRQAAEKEMQDKSEMTAGVADARSRMSALQDVQQGQAQLFRDIGVNMSDIAKDANASSKLLDYKLRTPEYLMGAHSAVQGEQVNTPYFRGQEPFYRTPNTLFADLLQGGGQLGVSYLTTRPKTTGTKT